MSDGCTPADREYLRHYKREIHAVELLMSCSPNDLVNENARKGFDHLKKALVLHMSHSESLWRELQRKKAKDESRFTTNPEPFVVVSAGEINAMRDEMDRHRDAYGQMRDELIAIKARCDELIGQAKEAGGA